MRKITFVVSIIVLFLCLIAPSCANRGQGPQGGPKDTIPPVVLHENKQSTTCWGCVQLECTTVPGDYTPGNYGAEITLTLEAQS